MPTRRTEEQARRVHESVACPDREVVDWIGRHLQLVNRPGQEVYDHALREKIRLATQEVEVLREMAMWLAQAEDWRSGAMSALLAGSHEYDLSSFPDRWESWLDCLERWWGLAQACDWRYLTLLRWGLAERSALLVLLDDMNYLPREGIRAFQRLGGTRPSYYRRRRSLRLDH